jgi:hypothetical protein
LHNLSTPNTVGRLSTKFHQLISCSFIGALSMTPSSPGIGPAPSLLFGLCVPSSCSRSSLVALIHSVLKNSSINENNLHCSNDPANGQESLTGGAIVTIIILSALCLLVLIGTLFDIIIMSSSKTVTKIPTHINGYNNLIDSATTDADLRTESEYKPNIPMKFLAEFSALRSLGRIFTMEQRVDHDTYSFINGIRVLSLFWVIIGHTLVFSLGYSSNPVDVLAWTHNILFQLILNAVFSVDTFFVLSGFLTAILFVRHVDKQGGLSSRMMILYYLHRYIRLTPTFLLTILVSINLTPYFGSGPIYPKQQGFELPQCRSQYWWTAIAYVGNLVKPDYMCSPITWYLHNDMQFHWIAPLSLIPFVLRRKVAGMFIAALLALIGSISILSILLYYPHLSLNTLTEFSNPVSFHRSLFLCSYNSFRFRMGLVSSN